MSRHDRLYLNDMIEACEKILAWMTGPADNAWKRWKQTRVRR